MRTGALPGGEGGHGIPAQREPGALDERRVGDARDTGADEAADGAQRGAGEVGHPHILAKRWRAAESADQPDAVARAGARPPEPAGRRVGDWGA